MTNAEIRQYINFLLNKEQTSGIPGPTEFGNLLKAANERAIARLASPWVEDPAATFNMRDVEEYFSYTLGGPQGAALPVITNGVIQNPDMIRMVSMRWLISGVYYPVDIVTNDEIGDRLRNPMTSTTPFIVVNNGNIEIYPTSLSSTGSFIMTIVRKPETPIYDYYILNSTGEEYPLAEGEVPPAAGVTYSGLSSAPGNDSATVDLDWPSSAHHVLIRMILMDIGYNLLSEEFVKLSETQKMT